MSKCDGGLGLVDVRNKHKALLLNWVKDCMSKPQILNLAEAFLGPLTKEGLIFKLNVKLKDSKRWFVGNTFWHNIIHLWHEYSYHDPQNDISVQNQIICYNSEIKIDNKPMSHERWKTCTVGDIWDGEEFLQVNEMYVKLGIKCNWLERKSLCNAIPSHWKFFLKTPNLIDDHIQKFVLINNMEKISQFVYQESIC